ncbi:hypothetical protein FNH08_36325 [Streptomyces spongiae]|uniref:Uncharacterized protein n=2 Tax=Streptomyces spongiae TaxID=565072 RepID=A0A5N8XSP0_9ACTN|nr:hypothetical protein [Streptomyces spongiae]
MVYRLLGPPDRLALNPRFRAAPPTRLYRAERVEAAERGEEFRVVAEGAARRSEAVRAALWRRQEEVLDRIRTEPLDVPRLDPGKLALRAVEHRARIEAGAGRGEGAGAGTGTGTGTGTRVVGEQGATPAAALGPADRASLDPWKVDYLRQRLVNQYGRLLDGLPGGGPAATGRAEAVALLDQRIYAAIAEAHPNLAQECERRMGDQQLGPPSR